MNSGLLISMILQLGAGAAVPPSSAGIEYALPENLLHYAMDGEPLDYSLPDNLLHYAMDHED